VKSVGRSELSRSLTLAAPIGAASIGNFYTFNKLGRRFSSSGALSFGGEFAVVHFVDAAGDYPRETLAHFGDRDPRDFAENNCRRTFSEPFSPFGPKLV
jgi:hypothetical protein